MTSGKFVNLAAAAVLAVGLAACQRDAEDTTAADTAPPPATADGMAATVPPADSAMPVTPMDSVPPPVNDSAPLPGS